MSTVTGYASVFHRVLSQKRVQLPPQRLIRDWHQFVPLLALPAVRFPLGQPLTHPFAHIDTVSQQLHMASAFERSKPLNGRCKFHLVVGTQLLAARAFHFRARRRVTQDESPTAGAGVATASAVGKEL